MCILFLDIASHQGTLACVTPEKVLAMKTVDTKISDSALPGLLEELWNEARWDPKDITHIAFVKGPGGFMSLRVAAASANALAWGLSIPSCGIHLSDLYAARSPSPLAPLPRGEGERSSPFPQGGRAGDEGTLWIHSTKKEEVFMRGFGTYAAVFPEATHLKLADFEAHLSGPFRFMGELIPEHEALLHAKGGERAELHELKDILPSFLTFLSYGRKTLEPWYGREG